MPTYVYIYISIYKYTYVCIYIYTYYDGIISRLQGAQQLLLTATTNSYY